MTMKRWILILLLLTTGTFALVWCKADQRKLKSEIYKNQALLVSLDVELQDLQILQQGEISSHVQNGAELYEGLVDLKNHGLIEFSPIFANWEK